MFSSANILPIADDVHWVVFLLFLLCFWPVVHLFLFRLKCSAILYCSVPKQINIISRASRSAVQFPGNYICCSIDVIFHISEISSKFGKTVAGCGELSVRFELIGNGEIFWMNNNKYYLTLIQKLKIN